MSARLAAARRIRTVAAAALVAAVAGTAFVPAAATAAEGTGKPLTMTLGAPVPDSTVERGGDTRSMTLTVTNSSDRAQDFRAWLPGTAEGPSPLLKDSVVFGVTALDAPATKSATGRQDGQWQGLFFPASGDASSAFSVPAHEEFTWKVTFGLGASYPGNDGDFTLTAQPLGGNVTADPARNTVVLDTEPAIEPGTLEVRLDPTAGVVLRPGEHAAMALSTLATGPGEFPAEIDRTLVIDASEDMDFGLKAEIGGRTVKLAEPAPNRFELPALPKGFGSAAGRDVLKLDLSLDKGSEVAKETRVRLHALYEMEEGQPFVDSLADARIRPAQTSTGSPSPSASPSTQPSSPAPSATPAESASPGATAAPSAATTTAAAGTTGGTSGGTTTTGALASTGSGAGLYATVAGALLALGFAAAAIGRRRRATAA
ncbi:hypothetical protein [Streptomyces sp. NPDC093094]|uniref:hypothetical protein n=1 Tax=Streptomyces sp. NPDC093094 TaxID=3366026 RepID=UPI00382FDCFD